MEGRAALKARRELDEFFFHTEQSQLTRGNVAVDIDALKRAIILETLAEQATLREQARDAGGSLRKGIKAGMLKLMGDRDRFLWFNDDDEGCDSRDRAWPVAFFAKTGSTICGGYSQARHRGICALPSINRPL